MGDATLPRVSFMMGGQKINALSGYVDDMDIAAMRDTITPLESDGTLKMQIEKNDNQIREISYSVYSLDGTETYDKGTLKSAESEDVTLKLGKSLGDKIQEAVLQVSLVIGEEKETRKVNFYTRIEKADDITASQCLTFAQDFHKPKADGTEGPVVRKVKIQKKQTMGVFVDSGNGIAENGGMVRIDVYRVNGKYYFVPVYTADVVKKVLPNRAATAHKPYGEWKVMEDKDFLFSLYSRDLIHIKSKKDIPIKMVNGGMEGIKETYAYYIGADISAANIQGIAHDSRYKFRGLGIQRLDVLEKCQIDVLGHVSVVRSEKRMGFS